MDARHVNRRLPCHERTRHRELGLSDLRHFAAFTQMTRADLCLDPPPRVSTPYYRPAANTRIVRRPLFPLGESLETVASTSHFKLRRQRSFAEARRAER